MEEPYGQMIVEVIFFLANHRAGCNIINKLVMNKVEVALERAPVKMKQFNISEFHKQSKASARKTIAGEFKGGECTDCGVERVSVQDAPPPRL